MSEQPSGTITFLFTDIEGSTHLWEHHPEEMRVALAHHDALVRECILEAGGHVFKTVGDAFCAAFHRPTDAMAAAVRSQQRLCADEAGLAVPIRVRMALHTGVADERDGDYFGPTLNRTARLLAIGHGGQILLSEACAALLQAGGPGGAKLLDMGSHRLKDLLLPERVFQVLHETIPSRFPPLQSLSGGGDSLPIQLTSFVGREKELGEIADLLESARLITLVGPGGTGKTRLALQAAAERADTFADGARLAELGAITDAELVPQVVATALGVRETGGSSLTQMLTEYLRSRHLLLVLDNCEHLLETSARLVETLLKQCPRLTVIATSREPLGSAGERVYRVPSMRAPERGRAVTVADLQQFEAVRLFQDRAAASLNGFSVTDKNASAVAELCARLDGIPMAIELAAARVKALPVERIVERLDDRFRLLTQGSRTALGRHQTLRALIDWSYDMLSVREQTVLERLSVFAGGWDVEAAEAICADGPDSLVAEPIEDWEVLDLLSQLVDKSLVVFESHLGRYRLLETVRQYAREKLAGSPDAAAVGARHLTYYLGLAERAEPALRTSAQAEWLERLGTEFDNLRAAMEHGASADPSGGARIAAALWEFWLVVCHFSEGYRWLDHAHQVADLEPAIRAKALLGATWVADALGLRERAIELAQQGLECAASAGDPWFSALLRMMLAWVSRDGDPAVSQASFDEALRSARQIGDPWLLAQVLSTAGVFRLYRGAPEGAGDLFREGIAVAKKSGDRWLIGELLHNAGLASTLERDYESMHAFFTESLVVRRAMDDRNGMAITLHALGMVALKRGELDLGREHLVEALKLRRDLGTKPGIATSLGSLALLAIARGDHSSGMRLIGAYNALLSALPGRRLSIWQEDVEAGLSAARARLAPADAEQAQAEGAVMTIDQAVQFAINENTQADGQEVCPVSAND